MRRGDGESSFTVDGVTWRLRFDFNAMADLEEETKKPALEVLEALEKGTASAADMRALMWACLRDHHPDVTVREAGRLVGDGAPSMLAAIQAAFPSAPDSAGGAPKKTRAARPRRAA